MMALLAFIPGRDWFYGALIIGVGVLCWHFYDKYTAAVQFAWQVKQQSAVVTKQAAQDIKDKDTQHATTLAKVTETYAAALKSANDQRATDADRLRDFDAYRQSHPVLDRPAGAGSKPGADPWVSSLVALEQVAAELADELRKARDQRDACVLERDSLTGK
jgi:hypothetical protein